MVVPVNTALAASTRSNPPEPVKVRRLNCAPPLRRDYCKVSFDVRYRRRAVVEFVESAVTVEANGSAAVAANGADALRDKCSKIQI